jgi:hypothetical protein
VKVVFVLISVMTSATTAVLSYREYGREERLEKIETQIEALEKKVDKNYVDLEKFGQRIWSDCNDKAVSQTEFSLWRSAWKLEKDKERGEILELFKLSWGQENEFRQDLGIQRDQIKTLKAEVKSLKDKQ